MPALRGCPIALKKIAVVQSNYIPWKGYFDLIAAVDEFILYDDVQYTRRDWRNRNRIKTPTGLQWLTVPIKVRGRYNQTIRETEIEGTEWSSAHWKTLVQYYRRSACFAEVAQWLEPFYSSGRYSSLSALNRDLTESVCAYLGIGTKITSSDQYTLSPEGPTERLADLCTQAQATEYISGPSARNYIDEAFFHGRGISVEWFEYAGYPEYPQLWGVFEHSVTILDLLFNCGRKSPQYMKHLRT